MADNNPPPLHKRKVGYIAIARSTFDVDLATAQCEKMFNVLDSLECQLVGSKQPFFTEEDCLSAFHDIMKDDSDVDVILVLQLTFTDAGFVSKLASLTSLPLALWAPPEERTGGRLRLNAFCGLNLAGHALGRRNRPFSYLYANPDHDGIAKDVHDLVSGQRPSDLIPVPLAISAPTTTTTSSLLDGVRIARIGEPPNGFDTCIFNQRKMRALGSIVIEDLTLETLFNTALEIDQAQVTKLHDQLQKDIRFLDDMPQGALEKSLRMRLALDEIQQAGDFDAFAIRCWPETFTHFGAAVCAPVAMLGDNGIPCACEADVYGALTQVLLTRLTAKPTFLTDLVDLDADDNTGVIWHCGQAPLSMADPDSNKDAVLHSNRKLPLLFSFPLRPGRITMFRLSQAKGRALAFIAGAEILPSPQAFQGTAGVFRFDRPAKVMLDRIMSSGLEHHMAIAYGEHRSALTQSVHDMGIPVIDLTAEDGDTRD